MTSTIASNSKNDIQESLKEILLKTAKEESSIRTKVPDSMKFVLKASIGCMLVGSMVGLTKAIWRGNHHHMYGLNRFIRHRTIAKGEKKEMTTGNRMNTSQALNPDNASTNPYGNPTLNATVNPRIHSFLYGMNWLMVGFSFFSIREVLLYYRHFINDQKGVKNSLTMNLDGVVASAGSGLITGGFFAYHTSGPWAIIGGSMAYGLLFTGGQILANMIRLWKQNRALDRHLHPENYKRQSMMGKDGWWWNKTISAADTPIINSPSFQEMVHFDPFAYAVLRTTEFAKEYVFSDYPAWASPFVHTFDLEYKQKLRKQVLETEAQISILTEAIASIKK